jgi:hypothetical protein
MTLTWELIDETAWLLGVNQRTRDKWKQRRVPYKWQLEITRHLMARGQSVALADFEQFDKLSPRIVTETHDATLPR